MRGHVLVDKQNGRRWLYIPEAHIYLFVGDAGRGGWIVAAYRSDGYWGKTPATAIPTVEHLRQEYNFTAEVEVPQHVVDFAVESEQKRHESVDAFEQLLKQTVRTGDQQAGWRELQAILHSETLEKADDPDKEDRVAREIHQIIVSAGGLQ